MAQLLTSKAAPPSPTDEGMSAEDLYALNNAMRQVMDLCKWTLTLGDMDLSRLLIATEGRYVSAIGCYTPGKQPVTSWSTHSQSKHHNVQLVLWNFK